MNRKSIAIKRTFDVVVSLLGIVLFAWLIALAWFLASIDTRRNGFFSQIRIGQFGRPFKILKIRTMRDMKGVNSTVTTAADARITRLGRFWRRTKIDELPQLINIFVGQMSFVGPRPDVPGFADKLAGDDRLILSVRPGITGPATIKYRDEETLLNSVADPERYNSEVLFPDKVALNRQYVLNYSFKADIGYILATLRG